MARNTIRLGYLVSHPIQYQAPLLRRLAQEPGISLKVFYCSGETAGTYFDVGFNAPIKWDVPLLDGYDYEILPTIGHSRSFTFWRPFTYGLAKRLRRNAIDALWVHGYATWSSLSALVVAHMLGIKVLVRGESTLASSSERYGKRYFFKWLDHVVDAFLTIGSQNHAFYRHYGISDRKISCVPYAVDNNAFQSNIARAAAGRNDLMSSLGLVPGRPVVLYAGKLSARKRPLDLLEAFWRYLQGTREEPAAYLLFVGEGEIRAALERHIRLRELHASVRLLGFKNQSELSAYYELCNVFVLPSMREPWGLVVNEAMNAGCAIIVSDEVGCAADLVEDGVNGYLFKAGDVDALSETLARMLSSPARMAAMGRASLERVRDWGYEQDIKGLCTALSDIFHR